jgi:hypothetical protein
MRVTAVDVTRRNTKCFGVEVGDIDLVFSYNTLVGVRYRGHAAHARNVWGPTTGKHLNESGARSWGKEVDQEEVEKLAAWAFMEQGLQQFKDTLEGKEAA